MGSKGGPVVELRAKLEQLALLELVAESRQQKLEEMLDAAIDSGLDADMIRKELKLSETSLKSLTDGCTPELHERLGISTESAERLRKEATS